MSRSSSHSNSGDRKRKSPGAASAVAASELHDRDVNAVKTGARLKDIKKEQDKSEPQPQENAENNEENPKQSDGHPDISTKYSEAKRRALQARRTLDASIRQRQQAVSIKKYMAHLETTFGGHLRNVEKQLRLCRQSNQKLAEELKIIKGAVVTGESKKKRSTNATCPTLSRPQTVVSVPEDANEHLGEELIMDQKIDMEAQKLNSDGDFTVITLNTKEDFPAGSWLGDEGNPKMRVRCPIFPEDMVHIMSMNKSPEKVALRLLDLLFDKETQATSNLSGTGKHRKKKLDPLLIYGLHCHLVKHYDISKRDWFRIRQNIDSKCRTAFRRKQKGLDLTPRPVKRTKRTFVSDEGTTFTAHVDQDFQHNEEVEHLQQVVSQLQGLQRITIIREQTEGEVQVDGSAPAIVGHTVLHHEGGHIHPNQLSEVHLSTGQTIAITQSGELEIREVQEK